MSESDSTDAIASLSALRAFDAAARQGSFLAAARVLGLTPSAISHQIRALELRLGAALFHRRARSIMLTDAGAQLAVHVRDGFAAIERGIAAVRDAPRTRQIRVSALSLFNQTVLIPNLDRFTRAFPQYDVRVEATSRFVEFERDDVDIAIRVGEGPWPGLKAEELLRFRGAPVANPGFLAERQLGTAADLAGVRLVHDTAQPDAWRAWFAARGVTRPNHPSDLWFDSAPATLLAAEQRLGVAYGIDPLVRLWPGFGTRISLVFPEERGGSGRYWLVRRTQADHDPKTRVFMSFLREACRELARLDAQMAQPRRTA